MTSSAARLTWGLVAVGSVLTVWALLRMAMRLLALAFIDPPPTGLAVLTPTGAELLLVLVTGIGMPVAAAIAVALAWRRAFQGRWAASSVAGAVSVLAALLALV